MRRAYWNGGEEARLPDQGRGGELDLEKAAGILLTDYRSGTLGRISLETPASRPHVRLQRPCAAPCEIADAADTDD